MNDIVMVAWPPCGDWAAAADWLAGAAVDWLAAGPLAAGAWLGFAAALDGAATLAAVEGLLA